MERSKHEWGGSGGVWPHYQLGWDNLHKSFQLLTAKTDQISQTPATVCKRWRSKHIKFKKQFQHTIQWGINVAAFVYKSEFLYFIHNNTALLNSGPGRYPSHCLPGAFLSESNWSNKCTRKSNLVGWCGFLTQIGFYLRCCTSIPSLFWSRTVVMTKFSVATASTRL